MSLSCFYDCEQVLLWIDDKTYHRIAMFSSDIICDMFLTCIKGNFFVHLSAEMRFFVPEKHVIKS